MSRLEERTPPVSETVPRFEFDDAGFGVRMDLTLAADLGTITPVIEEVMKIVRELGWAAGRELDVEIALREALANAVKHGSGNDPSKTIRCSVAGDPERGMLIVVSDDGPGFDPASLPSPVVGTNVYSTHGRGIYLINQLMDEVRFERGGTEIHMRKHPPAAGKGPAR
jgi:serine/threonine-protein kinase RsbW